jgi:hypothetical protein
LIVALEAKNMTKKTDITVDIERIVRALRDNPMGRARLSRLLSRNPTAISRVLKIMQADGLVTGAGGSGKCLVKLTNKETVEA